MGGERQRAFDVSSVSAHASCMLSVCMFFRRKQSKSKGRGEVGDGSIFFFVVLHIGRNSLLACLLCLVKTPYLPFLSVHGFFFVSC